MKQSKDNNRKKDREFGFLAGIVTILTAVFLYLKGGYVNFYLVIPGLLSILSGIITPQWLTPLRKAWEAIGAILGKLNTYLILIIIYFTLFVPLGWLLKLMGKDLLDRKINTKLGSFWVAKQSNQEDSTKYQF